MVSSNILSFSTEEEDISRRAPLLLFKTALKFTRACLCVWKKAKCFYY